MSHFEELRYGPGMMLHGLYPEVSQGSSVPLSVKDRDLRVMVSILLAIEIESFYACIDHLHAGHISLEIL